MFYILPVRNDSYHMVSMIHTIWYDGLHLRCVVVLTFLHSDEKMTLLN